MKNLSNATLWEPLEIELSCEKTYEHPYLDVEIDATFIHADGTKMTVPGFWKKADIFAVRFTPVKLGAWSYTVTSNDGAISASGSFDVAPNTSDLAVKKHGFITVKHNKKYFTYEDGTPFFWLGDTNWQAPNYIQVDACNYPGCTCRNQFRHEVDNRIQKGFTVYQTYFDTSEVDGGGGGHILPSLWDEQFVQPSDQFNKKVDKMFEYLNTVGMVCALGFGVHVHTASSMALEDMKRFARYIMARYGCYSIVWITAQEITRMKPSKNEHLTAMDYYMELADYVANLDAYKHPIGAHMDVMDVTDERAQRLKYAPWQTCWIEQGGHGIGMVPKKSHYKGYCEAIINNERPVVEGEMAYEEINCGRFSTTKAARASGWNSFMNGLAGYTYGATGIWANGYSSEVFSGWLGEHASYSYDPWYMGLDKPGSFEMSYLKKFFELLPDWTKLVPSYYDTELASFNEDDMKLMMRDSEGKYIVCYFRNEDTSTGELFKLNGDTYKALWYNVTTGKYVFIEDGIKGDSYVIPQKPTTEDWAFILTSDLDLELPLEAPYEMLETGRRFGTLLKPLSVDAIGGKYYRYGGLYDQTSYLTDGDPDTSWIPFSQRTMQSIIFDFGTARDLSHIRITPAKDVLFPDFRVEVSDNNVDWTIIVNTLTDNITYPVGEVIERELCGTHRFVKLQLLTRKDMTDEEVEKANYRFVENKHSMNSGWKGFSKYACTEIIHLEIFGK